MRRIISLFNLMVFVTLTGCTASFVLQTDSNPLISPVTELPPTAFPTSAATDFPLVPISVEQSTQEVSAKTSSPTPTSIAQLSSSVDRPALESITILEKTSRFGIPYDEEYSYQIDTALWQPVISFDEGEWVVRRITTISPPSCTIEIKTGLENPVDAETVRQKQNRYRSMGTFATAGLVYDLFYYTSNANGLADTQHVFYILTFAGGDKPYLVKPLHHAFSAYKDWEDCRPLVRSALSTLVMKRVPVAP